MQNFGVLGIRIVWWVTYLPTNLRDTLWPWLEPGHGHISFRAGSWPSNGMFKDDTGHKTRNMEAKEMQGKEIYEYKHYFNCYIREVMGFILARNRSNYFQK